jgi:hypothetical protein
MPDGRFFPLIAGGSGDEEEGHEDEEQEEEEEEEQEADDPIKDPAAKIKALEDEKSRHAKKAKRLEREKAELEKKLKEKEDAEKTDEERKSEELVGKERRIAELETAVAERDATILMLSHEKISALPPKGRKFAMKLLSDDLEIDEDGDSNLEELVVALEKEYPQLFEEPGDDDDEEEQKRSASPPKKRKDKTSGYTPEELVKRMPHLARHRST